MNGQTCRQHQALRQKHWRPFVPASGSTTGAQDAERRTSNMFRSGVLESVDHTQKKNTINRYNHVFVFNPHFYLYPQRSYGQPAVTGVFPSPPPAHIATAEVISLVDRSSRQYFWNITVNTKIWLWLYYCCR